MDVEQGQVSIELESLDPEREFVEMLWEQLIPRYHRTQEDGLYENDLWFDMFSCKGEGGKLFWHMSATHPYACMLRANNMDPCVTLNGSMGITEIHEHKNVKKTIRTVLAWMKQFEKPIQEEENELFSD